MLSIALSYEEGDGIVRPDRRVMGVGDKMVWLPSPLRTLARLQDIRVPKQESEIAELHLRFTSMYPQDTSLTVAVNFIYVQVCKNVCTYIYLLNRCRQVKLPRLLSVSLLFKKVRSPPWRKRLLLTGMLKSYRPRLFDRTLGFYTSSIQYGKLATPCREAKSFARFFRDLRTSNGKY